MSAAANNWLKDRPLLTVVFSFCSALIILGTERSCNSADAKVVEIRTELREKATYKYVDDKLDAHEETDAARYEGIKDMFEITSNQLNEIKQDIKELRKEVR